MLLACIVPANPVGQASTTIKRRPTLLLSPETYDGDVALWLEFLHKTTGYKKELVPRPRYRRVRTE